MKGHYVSPTSLIARLQARRGLGLCFTRFCLNAPESWDLASKHLKEGPIAKAAYEEAYESPHQGTSSCECLDHPNLIATSKEPFQFKVTCLKPQELTNIAAVAIGIAPGSKTTIFEKLRFADDIPMHATSLHRMYSRSRGSRFGRSFCKA